MFPVLINGFSPVIVPVQSVRKIFCVRRNPLLYCLDFVILFEKSSLLSSLISTCFCSIPRIHECPAFYRMIAFTETAFLFFIIHICHISSSHGLRNYFRIHQPFLIDDQDIDSTFGGFSEYFSS
eukprot:Sdes_comp15409_c0_seq1m4288